MKAMDHAPERKISLPLVDFKRYGTSAWRSPQAQASFSTLSELISFICQVDAPTNRIFTGSDLELDFGRRLVRESRAATSS